MAKKELEGASMPDGIEVDVNAAYFGVVASSDMVHTLMAMEQNKAMEKFFSILSDVVLLPGDFDFEAASERIQCEGGEIYYLVTSHLGLMSLPDPLSNYLGLPDSLGDISGNSPSISDEEQNKLSTLADPMRILKLLAIASTTGSDGEVTRYHNAITGLFANPEANKATLLDVVDELDAAMDVAGHALPIPSLASGEAATASIALPTKTTSVPRSSSPEAIPLPTAKKQDVLPLPEPSKPAASQTSVDLPIVAETPVPEPVIDTNNQILFLYNHRDRILS